MFDLFSIGTSKSNLVLGKKADFTPTELFQGTERSNPSPTISEDNSQIRDGKDKKKNLRCTEFCFALSHAAKPKQNLRSVTNSCV